MITRRLRIALSLLPFLLLPSMARAIVAGDPNGNPADSPNTPYNSATQTGRLDTLGMDSPFSGVGSIYGGTGSLIDSTHVLTAAHLFGSNFSKTADVAFDLNGVGYQASRVDVHPQYPNTIQPDDLYDIAVVTLRDPVPITIKTYGLYNSPLMLGTTLTLVGYGQTGDGVNGYGSYPGGRRVGRNNLDAYLLPGGTFSETSQNDAHTYGFDFDGPNATTSVFGDAGQPGNLTLGNNVETTVGTGDSGGPAFIFVNGEYQIAALNNFTFDLNSPTDKSHPTAGHFGSGGGGAIVSAYSGFISNAISPTPEPGSVPVFGVGAAFVLAALRRTRKR